MILYIVISYVLYVTDEIKRLADGTEEHPNISAIRESHERSQNNRPIKKKITSRLIYLIVL